MTSRRPVRPVVAPDGAEVRAFEAVHRCCSEALDEYLRACAVVDARERSAVCAVLAGDVRTAVLHTRRAIDAERNRPEAWCAYREAFDLLLALVRRTSQQLARGDAALVAAG